MFIFIEVTTLCSKTCLFIQSDQIRFIWMAEYIQSWQRFFLVYLFSYWLFAWFSE